MVANSVTPSPGQLANFCRRRHIRKLSLFGSVLREDFRLDSDVDLLVTFDPSHTPTFFTLYDMEQELSALFGGRRIDLVVENALKPRLRPHILPTAQVLYAEG